jgi:hypothetical protein
MLKLGTVATVHLRFDAYQQPKSFAGVFGDRFQDFGNFMHGRRGQKFQRHDNLRLSQ